MNKPDIYKAYDKVFNNKKTSHINRLLKKAEKYIDRNNSYYEARINAYTGYCTEFLKDKTQIIATDKFRFSYAKGFERYYEWGNSWEQADILQYGTSFIKHILNNFTTEGQNIFNDIETFNTGTIISNKRYKLGTIQPYHKQYFYLPSYVQAKKNYPINLIFKNYGHEISINIPAFHRYSINNKWASDAESLKRQMLLVEFYDDIVKHLNDIIKDISKRHKTLASKKRKLLKRIAKYEVLTTI